MPEKYVVKKVTLPNNEIMGYRQAGHNGPVLVLVHGNMTSSKHMEILMDELAPQYRLYAVDMRGFGVTSYRRRIRSIKNLADDIKLWADALGILRFSIIGWSTGGGVAVQFAAEHPDYVEKLILIASVGIKGCHLIRTKKPVKRDEPVGKWDTRIGKLKMEIAYWGVGCLISRQRYPNQDFARNVWDKQVYNINRPDPALYAEYIEDTMTQRNVWDLTYALANFNISDEHNGSIPGNGMVHRIIAPTLVLQGDRDLVINQQVGREIAVALGSRAELVILQNSGHSPLIDCMGILAENIRRFV